jgi:DNA repair protein RadC
MIAPEPSVSQVPSPNSVAMVAEASAPHRFPAPPPLERAEVLRRRVAALGPHALAEAEALELLLARCGARGPHPALLAGALLRRFGSLPQVFGASLAELAALVGEPVGVELKLLHDLTLRVLEFPIHRRSVLSSWAAVSAYLKASLGGRSREAFRVLYLDKANQLIADELMGEGTIDHAPVYPREVMRRALELAASACCLVHNHPTGSATPSKADIDMTRQVIEAGRTLGIAIHDHFLVAGDEVVSFKGLGLM